MRNPAVVQNAAMPIDPNANSVSFISVLLVVEFDVVVHFFECCGVCCVVVDVSAVGSSVSVFSHSIHPIPRLRCFL